MTEVDILDILHFCFKLNVRFLFGKVYHVIIKLNMGNIFVFGDSIAAGAWDTKGGWPTRLAKTIVEYEKASGIKFWSRVTNLSIDGDMVTDLNSRLVEEYQKRSWASINNVLVGGYRRKRL